MEPSSFASYLRQAGSLYEIFQRARSEDEEGAIKRERAHGALRSEQQPRVDSLNNSGLPETPYYPKSPTTSTTSPLSPSERPTARRRISGRRRGPPAVAPLSTIPNVYFEPNFQLENPRTFDVVSERSEIVQPPGVSDSPRASGRKALATNAILQEKLSWYMDTVEVHLISSISTASSSFFAALGSLRELHLEAASSVSKITSLRKDLASLDNNMAQGGLKIVRLRKRQTNMRKLGNAVEQLRMVVQAVALCEEQVDKGEIEFALDGLENVEGLIAGKALSTTLLQPTQLLYDQEHLIDLRGINALQGSGEDIAYLKHKIGKTFEARFLEALLGDMRHHVDSVPADLTFERWDNASQRNRGNHARRPSVYPAYLKIDDFLRSKVQINLEGLAKSDCLKQATTAYREALWREFKTLIRRHLPSSADDDVDSTVSGSTQGGRRTNQQEKSSVLARNLRDLDAEESENMLRRIYSNIGEALRRLGTQVKIVLDITSSFTSQLSRSNVNTPLSPPVADMSHYMTGPGALSAARTSAQQEEIQQTLDMSNLLGQAVDIAQAQIVKVLKVRSEQSIQLSLHQFLRYFNLNRMFADECEAVSGRSGTALKTIVHAHIKDFVQRSGDTQRQNLVETMDADRWDAKDFAGPHAQFLTDVVTASTQEIETWSKGDVVFAHEHTAVNCKGQTNGVLPNGTDPGTKDKGRSASIDEQKYILPQSALTLLSGISYFEQIITGIPSMTQEITTSLLEYLRLFNSRSSQLILGAGATRSAGLKNITTKHLAIASQALSFVVALVPYIREFVRRHQTNPQALMIEFDKVKRLYQEHQSGINDKLVDIMSSRAATHVAAMKKVDWDAPSNAAGVSAYMETLVKETTTLHKVLSKHLPGSTVNSVMEPVFQSYREQWHKAFQEVDVKTSTGKDRILRDLEYFKSRMSKLDGGGGVGEAVVSVVNEKAVATETGSNKDVKATIPNGTTAATVTNSNSAETPTHGSE